VSASPAGSDGDRNGPDAAAESGRQLERTALSWNRTLVALAGCAALLIRDGLGESGPPAVVLGGLVMVVAATIAVAVQRAYRRPGAGRARHSLFGGRAVPVLVTGLVVFMAVAAIALAVREIAAG